MIIALLPHRSPGGFQPFDHRKCAAAALCPAQIMETDMADLYRKALESERKRLWATCRLKGLAKDTPERQRIAELDGLIREHDAKKKGD